MAINRGKQFEAKFAENWKAQFPSTPCIRLYDVMGGYSNVNNPCDFICFVNQKFFMIECKEHKEKSIPFSEMSQYPRLLEYKGMKDTYPAILIWFSDWDKVLWVPIEVAEQIYNSGEKSIGLRHLGKYDIIEIPSTKKRVLMDSDYSCIVY